MKLTDNEKKLVENFRAMNFEHRQAVLTVADAAARYCRNHPGPPHKPSPTKAPPPVVDVLLQGDLAA